MRPLPRESDSDSRGLTPRAPRFARTVRHCRPRRSHFGARNHETPSGRRCRLARTMPGCGIVGGSHPPGRRLLGRRRRRSRRPNPSASGICPTLTHVVDPTIALREDTLLAARPRNRAYCRNDLPLHRCGSIPGVDRDSVSSPPRQAKLATEGSLRDFKSIPAPCRLPVPCSRRSAGSPLPQQVPNEYSTISIAVCATARRMADACLGSRPQATLTRARLCRAWRLPTWVAAVLRQPGRLQVDQSP